MSMVLFALEKMVMSKPNAYSGLDFLKAVDI